MDQEIRRELDEIHALVRDNHQVLRAIRRGQWLSAVIKIIFWIFVIVTPLYLYQQYVQPMTAKFSEMTGTTFTGPFGLPTFAEMQKLINSNKVGQ